MIFTFHRLIGALVMTIFAVILCVPSSANAEFVIPPNDGLFTDAAGLLSKEREREIEQKLRQYQTETSNEIAVVIMNSLENYPIENAALEIGRKWEVGSVKNNGILMLIVYEDRQIRIEVGYGLEGVVPDIVAKGIIDTDITPSFRAGDYAGGISGALEALQKHIGREYTVERYAEDPDSSFGAFGFFFALIAFQWLIAVLSRTKSWWMGGVIGGIGGAFLAFLYGWWLAIPVLVPLGLFLDFIVSRNYHTRGPTRWWAGGGWGPGGGGGRFGGGSSGGFGGFGGGSFGGGGASGRW